MEKKAPNFFDKQVERMAYLFLRVSLIIGRITATLLTWCSFLVPKGGKQKDFLFFPYVPENNIGAISRFQIYLPYLEKDGYTYDIHYHTNEKEYVEIYFKSKSRTKEYLHHHNVFWCRLFKVLSARKYKAVLIQRGLFPDYYDQTIPYILRLLRKLNNNITIDYYDADYARNKILNNRTVALCDKVSVVNKFLFDYYSKIHPRVYYNNLAINVKQYPAKTDYTLSKPINIFWTGSVGNAVNLKMVIPVLEKINRDIPLKLTMISHSTAGFNSPIIEQHEWKAETFFKHMAGSDIAIYPCMEDTVYALGKIAYKTLEYAAAKVPIIASAYGLSQNFEGGKDVIIANNEAEWEAAFRKLIADEQLRRQLAENAYKKLLAYHDAPTTYKNLLQILSA